MPLTTCPDCKTDVSDAAAACPRCGRPMGGAVTRAASRSRAMATVTLAYAGMGFGLGFVLTWGGCGRFQSLAGRDLVLCAMGGVLFAILGAVIGAVVGAVVRR